MTQIEPLALLLEDLEETLWAEGHVPLYDFSWLLRGLDVGLSEAEIGDLCGAAYEAFGKRHALVLYWSEWPTDPSHFRIAEPGTALDFDLNSTGEVSVPFLVLVPAES